MAVGGRNLYQSPVWKLKHWGRIESGYQVLKGQDLTKHRGPFKESVDRISITAASKHVKLSLTSHSWLFIPQKCPSDNSACWLFAACRASGADSSVFSPSYPSTTAICPTEPLCHYCSCPIKCVVNQISIETLWTSHKNEMQIREFEPRV